MNNRWQVLAQKNWTSARAKQWLVAMLVCERDIRLKTESDDTLTKLRGAWQMYVFIRTYRPVQARRLRAAYGYSRFYEVYKKWMLYEMSPDECIEYIECDLSNTAMAMQIEDIHDSREEWERKSFGIYKTITKFTHVAYGAPEWFCDWAKKTRELFERNGIQ